MKFLFILIFVGFNTWAESLTLNAEIKMHGDNVKSVDTQQARQAGWTVNEVDGEEIYNLDVALDPSKLPYRTQLGDAYLSISKAGRIDLGLSVGDADAGAEGQLQWPTSEDGGFIKITAPLTLTVSGGDHASGAWSFNAKASITIK